MDYSTAAKAQMAGAVVRVDTLVEMMFASETIRLWNGFGPLTTLDGKVWTGAGQMGSISGTSQSINGSAPPLVLTLSGVDATFAAKAKAEETEYYNRPVVLYTQFFTEAWQPLDEPYGLTMARMTQITSRRSPGPNGPEYIVSITAETPFAVRRRPRYGYLTDPDQRRRYPGDLGLDRIAGINNKTITWPVAK